MATKLFVHFNDSSTVAGLAAFAGATRRLITSSPSGRNRTTILPASGVEIGWFDDTANLDTAWLSDFVATAFSMAGSISFSVRASESSTSVNAGLRMKVYKVPYAPATDDFVQVGSFSRSGEITASTATYTWGAAPGAAVGFAVNDRILVRGFFYAQGGTMAAGTANIECDSTNSFVEFTENFTLSATPTLPPVPPIYRNRRLLERSIRS